MGFKLPERGAEGKDANYRLSSNLGKEYDKNICKTQAPCILFRLYFFMLSF